LLFVVVMVLVVLVLALVLVLVLVLVGCLEWDLDFRDSVNMAAHSAILRRFISQSTWNGLWS